MEIVLNGERYEAPDGCSVAGLLAALGIDGGRVAVEVDGEIVRRPAWGERELRPGARVEIVHFVGGG